MQDYHQDFSNTMLRVAKTYVDFKNTQTDRATAEQDRMKKMASQQNIEKYAATLMRGEQVDPNTPGYDATDALSAKKLFVDSRFNDERVKQATMANDQARRKSNQSEIDGLISTAGIYAGQGKEKEARKIAAKVYDYLPDGNSFVKFDRDNVVLRNDSTGETFTEPTKSTKEYLEMATQFSKHYQAIDEKHTETRRSFNLEAIKNHDNVFTKDGKAAIRYQLQDHDGSVKTSVIDPVADKVIQGFDPVTGKQIESKEAYRTQAHWNKEKTGKLTEAKTNKLTEAKTNKLKEPKTVGTDKKRKLAIKKESFAYVQKVLAEDGYKLGTPEGDDEERKVSAAFAINRLGLPGDIIPRVSNKTGKRAWYSKTTDTMYDETGDPLVPEGKKQ